MQLAWNSDGSTVATGSWEETARLWSSTGEEMHVLKGHPDGGGSIAWSHSGSRLATASGCGSVMLWNCNTGVLVHELGTPYEPAQWLGAQMT